MKRILSKGSVAQITKWGLLALVLLLPQSARSAVRGGSFEVSPFLGYNFFCPQQNLKDGLIYGGRISYNFTSHFGLEATVDMVNTNINDPTITGAAKGQFRSPADKVDLFFYHLDAVYTFNPDDDFNIFAVAGFGAVNYSPSIESGDMSTFDLGLGAKYWLAKNFALRLDVRDDMVTETFQGSELLTNDYQNYNATLGVVFAFGGEPEKKEAAKATPVPTAVVVYVAEEPKVEEKIAIIATPTDEEKVVVLAFEDVHFKFGESKLSPSAKAIINRTVEILKANPKAHIRIAGYTSEAGTEDYNQRLSERRAEEVEYYLIKEGITAKDRLTTIGYGDDKPAIYEAAPKQHYSTAAKANMRVLFEVILK